MRKLSIVKCALLNLIFINFALHANDHHNAVENVIQRAYTSITRIEEGKIFLKPDHQGRLTFLNGTQKT